MHTAMLSHEIRHTGRCSGEMLEIVQDQEDLFTPGSFVLEGNEKMSITLWMALQPITPGDWNGWRKATGNNDQITPGRKAVSCGE